MVLCVLGKDETGVRFPLLAPLFLLFFAIYYPMSEEIKSLKPKQAPAPALWTMFEDSTGGLSYTRIVGFMVAVVFFFVWAYLSLNTGVMIIPPTEMVYILVAFAAAKPIQRFAESREVQDMLNYEFQISQIGKSLDKPPGS